MRWERRRRKKIGEIHTERRYGEKEMERRLKEEGKERKGDMEIRRYKEREGKSEVDKGKCQEQTEVDVP